MKTYIAKALTEPTAVPASELVEWIEIPPRPEMGDYAFPCFRLAKRMRMAPQKIAEALADQLREDAIFMEPFERLEAVGGYLNFFADRSRRAVRVLRESIAAGDGPGRSDAFAGQTIIIEFSSPNIAKPFHVGHAFSTILGEALANLYEYAGAKVERFNHLGDYGTQFGKLIVAWRTWGDEAALADDAIKELTRVYVKFHVEADAHPELEDEARAAFKRLEEGCPEEVALWRAFREKSLELFNRLYERLNISFDNTNGESFYSHLIPDVVALLKEKGLLEESEGAMVVNLDEFNLNPCLILKSDGSTIYATRDITAIYYRDREYNFDKNIYVVGLPQKNHFEQVFAVMRKAGFPKAGDCIHVAFGTVRFSEGSFSTRQGNAILLEDLLNTSVEKTAGIIRANNPEMSDEEVAAIAEKVGVGAVRFAYLRNSRERDIIFSWDDMLDFEGDTAPYLLYTVSRCASIGRKVEAQRQTDRSAVRDDQLARLTSEDEQELIRGIARFGDSVMSALRAHEPSILMRHLLNLARAFNRFYHNLPILKADDHDLMIARLVLTEAVERTLRAGLKLAGIETVERM